MGPAGGTDRAALPEGRWRASAVWVGDDAADLLASAGVWSERPRYGGGTLRDGLDAESGLVHSVIGTAANVADVTQAHDLLHGEEKVVFGDAGYIGVDKRPEARRAVVWHVAMRAGKRRALGGTAAGRLYERIER